MTEENPRFAAINASKSLGSNSLTWFSTGMRSNTFAAVMLSLLE
jgi:hypothetical protein